LSALHTCCRTGKLPWSLHRALILCLRDVKDIDVFCENISGSPITVGPPNFGQALLHGEGNYPVQNSY
jgi:hypothetical protein